MIWTRKTAAVLMGMAAVIATFALVSLDRGGVAVAAPDVGADIEQESTLAAYGSDSTGIWVSGQGTISVEPDLAMLDLGVETTAPTVSEANLQASTAMDAVLAALKARGVKDEDIQTSYFNIRPRYDYIEEEKDGIRSNREVLVGYRVRNSATVKVRDLDAVGEIIDEVVTAGGDNVRISDIRFTLEDPTPKMAELREMAVNDAKAKAEHLAELSDVSVGRLIYISEGAAATSVRGFADRGYGIEFAAMAAAPAPSISGGEVTLSLSVQAGFAIY